jgi:hypothetical protein
LIEDRLSIQSFDLHFYWRASLGFRIYWTRCENILESGLLVAREFMANEVVEPENNKKKTDEKKISLASHASNEFFSPSSSGCCCLWSKYLRLENIIGGGWLVLRVEI